LQQQTFRSKPWGFVINKRAICLIEIYLE